MSDNCIEKLKEGVDIKEFYHKLRQDILSTAKAESPERMDSDDVWDIVIREGLFQSLSENPSASFSILVITSYGPDGEYMNYLNITEDYSDLLAMVALSALVNDVIHHTIESSIDRID